MSRSSRISLFHPHSLRLILFTALVVRVAVWIVYVDHHSESYAEYGIIARYMSEGKGYSCFSQTADDYSYRYQPNAYPQPSALMMPGYTLFIYSGMQIPDVALRSFYYCSLQWLASLATLLLLYSWLHKRFSDSVAILSCWIYALLPEFIICANTYSSVVFVHLGIAAIGSLLPQEHSHEHSQEHSGSKRHLLLMLCAAAMMSLRAEAPLFLALLSLWLLRRTQRVQAASIVVGLMLFLVPWTVRNYQVFNAVVPLTTSGGINLYRGHNPYAVGVWSDDAIRQKLRDLPFTPRIELQVDSLHRAEALHTITTQPLVEAERTVQKLLTLMTVDLSDTRTLHPAYMVPSLIFMLLVSLGFVSMLRTRVAIPQEITIYFFCCIVTTCIFFCLPRYQSMMRIVLLPFAAQAISVLYTRFGKESST